MKKQLQTFNILWLLISLIAILLFSSYIIWQCFVQQFNFVNIAIAALLISSGVLNLIFILRTARHQENVEILNKKNLNIIKTSEECILLTDKNGYLEEIVRNHGSEKVLGNSEEINSGISVFNLLGISDEDSKEMIYQLLDGEPLQNRIFTFQANKDISREVLVSIYLFDSSAETFVFFINDLDWYKKFHNEM